MKTFFKNSGNNPLRGRRGVALIIVLEILVLIVILIVGFLAFATSSNKTSAAYQAATGTRQLSDMAVNLVEAQIADASTQPNMVWASQPGAVRLFKSTGELQTIYRLYSAPSMTATKVTDLAADLPPIDWASRPGLWTDLNASATLTDSTGATVTEYPILDPRNPTDLSKQVVMDGFSVKSISGAASADAAAPMPVRWLYLLQNGQLVAPVDSGDGYNMTIAGATQANPIVGRIAFWTDDDSCRLNINTASDGTFWDVPHWASTEDLPLAQNQPVQGEYQRYPGHPATTTLMKVFSAIAPTVITSSQALFNLLPYYSYGGSKGGTVATSTPIPAKTNPFFASTGEMLFYGSTLNNNTRALTGLSHQQLETGKFFLTAHSRSPELNLFGQPRISIWPEYSPVTDTTHTTATDRLIAFASTVNGHPYYFTRSNKDSGTADILISRNQSLLNYLDNLSGQEVPGYGGNFNSKYGTTEKRQILTEIFDYIRSTNLRDPAVGATYGGGKAIWGNTPGESQVTPAQQTTWGTQGFGNFNRVVEASLIFVGVGQGKTGTTLATPVNQAQLQGTSAVPYPGTDGKGTPPDNAIATQAMFVLSFFNPMQGWGASNPSFTVQIVGLDQFQLTSSNGTVTPLGMPKSASEYIGTYIANGTTAITRYGSFDYGLGGLGGPMDWRIMTGGRSFATAGTDPTTRFPFYSAILPIDISKGKTMTLTGANLKGALVTINLYSGNSTATADLVQTYTINYPGPQTLPVPNLAASGMRLFGSAFGTSNRGNYNGQTVVPVDRFDCYGNWVSLANSAYRILIDTANDVIFSMVPSTTWGDYRMLATKSVSSGAFVPDPSAGQQFAHGFCFPDGRDFTGSKRGTLISAPYYPGNPGNLLNSTYPNTTPFVPATVSIALTSKGTVGDWDNGVGSRPDGPFINKPDEGCVYDSGSETPYFDYQSSGNQSTAQPFFSVSREVPSAVMFGSLPTGIDPTGGTPNPWQTLLFRPGPAGHPGTASPPDDLLLDLFWMPYAQPYALSEPFSTEGTVNLNYQIVPFSYITRSTALRSVLASEKVAVVSSSQASIYKKYTSGTPTSQFQGSRVAIDLDQTLSQFDSRYTQGGFFKSSAEICDMYLIPQGYSSSGFAGTWYGPAFALVGDNERERPYADIYPRVTTRSNVYTVNVNVQMLKNPSTVPTQWNEKTGAIIGSYCGSTMIERYIDPNNEAIPDYASGVAAASLNTFYKWRVLGNYQFAP